MTTPANPDDLLAFLHQQLENQRFRGESLKTLAFALPPETGAYLTETGELLLADVSAKRRILAEAEGYSPEMEHGDNGEWAFNAVLRLLAVPFADREGFREEWRPA